MEALWRFPVSQSQERSENTWRGPQIVEWIHAQMAVMVLGRRENR